MEKTKLNIIKSEAHTAGETDTYTEGILTKSAQLYIAEQIPDELTIDEEQEVIDAYRKGFMHQPLVT